MSPHSPSGQAAGGVFRVITVKEAEYLIGYNMSYVMVAVAAVFQLDTPVARVQATNTISGCMTSNLETDTNKEKSRSLQLCK